MAAAAAAAAAAKKTCLEVGGGGGSTNKRDLSGRHPPAHQPAHSPNMTLGSIVSAYHAKKREGGGGRELVKQ